MWLAKIFIQAGCLSPAAWVGRGSARAVARDDPKGQDDVLLPRLGRSLALPEPRELTTNPREV